MSQALRAGLSRLDTTTRITLAVLALASGVYTYLGVRDLLEGEGLPVFFAAVVYSVAVSVGIYAFWSYLLFFLPHVRSWKDRRTLTLALILGSAMIVAMSSWLNAAALAGGAALEQHLATTAEEYQHRLDAAHSNALAAQGLLPDIELASSRFRRLAEEEEAGGALTGTSGSGTVVQLLHQMAADLESLAGEVRASRDLVDRLYEEGGENLSAMRTIVSASGPVEERSNAFGEEAVALAGVIASLQQTSIAPAVKRAADDLAATFVAPAAGGGTADLAARQSEVVERVQDAVEAQAQALSAAAQQILDREPVQPLRFTALSAPEAVVRYARDFLPSWAGAISIDLLPAVMILILAGVQSAIRREEGEELEEHSMTAGELMRAMRLYHRMRDEEREIEAGIPEGAGPAPLASDDRDHPLHVTRLSDAGPRRSSPGSD